MMESWDLRVIDSPSHLTSIKSFMIFPKISLIWKSVIFSINFEFYSLNPLTTFWKTLSQSLKLCDFIFITIDNFVIFFKNWHDIISTKSGKENAYIVFIIFHEELWAYVSHSKTLYISFNQIVESLTNFFHTKIFIDLS